MKSSAKKRFDDKVVVITGAGSGIGRATAGLFAEEGAKIVILDIDVRNGNEAADQLKSSGAECLFLKTDVSNAADVEKAIGITLSFYRKIDVWVNNTGIFMEGDIIRTSVEDWDRLLTVNLKGTFLCMKYCIPEMIKSGGGSIVNVASEAGLVGMANQVAYNVSKGGVIQLTKSAAVDFIKDNIRINCICPGRCFTPLVKKQLAESKNPSEKLRRLSEDRPIGRMAEPEELGATILFLASDEASFVVGSAFSVDGGYLAV